MFIDVAKIKIKAGDGGNGAVAFHREKYVAAGGPDGGDGGRGGNIVFQVDTNLSTLADFRYKRKYLAPNGENGRKNRCNGKNAEDLVIKVPQGTLIKEAETGRIVADLSTPEPQVILKGGKGGWGNAHFATPTRQTPRFAKPGIPGESMEVILELKLLADAVESAGFITEKKSEELIEKLCRLTSVYEAETLQEGFCANNGKSCNESIYYIADTINAAIAKRKKIAFYYFHYGPGKNRVLENDGKPYVFSPYKLVWNTDEYYVVGYSDKHEKLVSFRVDRIDRCPEILDEDAEPRPEKEELMRHIRTMTSMYDSRRERVTLLCDNAMMNAVVDAFGENVETKAFGDDAFTVETETAASPVFYRWVFGYGGKIRITEPENVKKEYAEMVKSAFENTCGRCGA